MEEYQVVRASEITGDPYKELLSLHQISFGQYEGVLPFDEEILHWYLGRPGLGLEHTLVVCHDGAIVSSLFLTLGTFLFVRQLIPAGIIDTVMTHPAHRGKAWPQGS